MKRLLRQSFNFPVLKIVHLHIGDWGEGSAHAIEPCVLARPGSLVQLLITIELASFQGENTSFSPLVGGLNPGIEGVELLLKENLREGDSAEGQHYQQLHLDRLVLL